MNNYAYTTVEDQIKKAQKGRNFLSLMNQLPKLSYLLTAITTLLTDTKNLILPEPMMQKHIILV